MVIVMSMVVSVFIGFEWFVVSFGCLMIVVEFAFIFEYLIILICFGNKKEAVSKVRQLFLCFS